MVKLRKFLRGCFANVALISLMVTATTVPALFSPRLLQAAGHIETGLLLFFLMPPVVAFVNGMAWWALRNGKPSGRWWAIVASISLLALGVLFLLADFAALRHAELGDLAWLLIVGGFLLYLGIAGIVAFSKRDSHMTASPQKSRIPGDGTHRSLDWLVLILQLGGMVAGMNLYMRWGFKRHLPVAHGLESWTQIILVILAVALIHESAHAMVGIALGMKLRAFIVGPFQWQMREGRWTFKFRLAELFSLSGATGLVPTDPNQSRWEEVVMIAAGPVSNLLTGAVAAALAFSAEDYPWWSFWEYFALFATVSLVGFLVNLIPFSPESNYSDGAQIYQILRGGPMADYHRVVRDVSSTIVTARRPADYDISTIQRASAAITAGHRGLMLRLFAASCYFDRGLYAESSSALAEAERTYHESAFDISAELHTSFVIKVVLLRHDAVSARQWWDRMEAKKPESFNQDYWLAKSALCWAENQGQIAREAWAIGSAYLEKLPNVGTYNYDRDCYIRMKKLLDGSPDAHSVTVTDERRTERLLASEILSPAPAIE
jgi:hypothetical protein